MALKKLILDELAGLATGVMLEPEYSIPELVDGLPDGIGFTAALESQGYSARPVVGARRVARGLERGTGERLRVRRLPSCWRTTPSPLPDHAAAQRATITSSSR